MFCLFSKVGYILAFAIRLSGVYTCPDLQVGYEMLILSAISTVAGSGVALGMWGYPTQRAIRIPLSLGPRALFLFIPTYIFSNQYGSLHVCAFRGSFSSSIGNRRAYASACENRNFT